MARKPVAIKEMHRARDAAYFMATLLARQNSSVRVSSRRDGGETAIQAVHHPYLRDRGGRLPAEGETRRERLPGFHRLREEICVRESATACSRSYGVRHRDALSSAPRWLRAHCRDISPSRNQLSCNRWPAMHGGSLQAVRHPTFPAVWLCEPSYFRDRSAPAAR